MATQIGRIGQLIILPVPGEFTTMAGRRLRDYASIFSIICNRGHINVNNVKYFKVYTLTDLCTSNIAK